MGRQFIGSRGYLGGGSHAVSEPRAKRFNPAAWNVIPAKGAPGARKRSRLGPTLALLAMLGGGYGSSVHPTPPVMSSLWSWTAIRDTIPDSDPMPSIGIGAPIPSGFLAFCLSHKSQCDAPLTGDKTIHLDGKVWHEIQQVNADVNESLRTRDDKDHYGRAEVWTIPTDGLGDCEDYALTKQKMLMGLGITLRALRLAVVDTRQGIGHVVLTVATDRGDYVLDNLSPWVLPWRQKDFTWFERQDPDHPWGWVQLNAKPGPVLTSSIGAGCPA